MPKSKKQQKSKKPGKRTKKAASKKFGKTLFEPAMTEEWKNIDAAVNNQVMGAGAVFSSGALVNGIAQGSGNTQRVGRAITLKSFLMRGYTSNSDSTGAYTGPVRVLVVYDRQANGTPPLITDVLVGDSFYSVVNLNKSKRFLIIADTVQQSSSSGFTSVKIFKKMQLETQFSATGATIADINSGSIYVFTSGVNPGTPVQYINWYSRMRYSDA